MSHAEAEHTLSEVARVRDRTRRALHPIWFSNIVVGAYFTGSAAVMALDAGLAVSLTYQIAGAALGLALIVAYAVRSERELGIESRLWDPALAIVGAIIAAAILLDGELAPLFAAAAGTAALGVVLRDRFELAAGVAIAVAAVAIAVLDPSEPWMWGNLALGLSLLGAGLAARP